MPQVAEYSKVHIEIESVIRQRLIAIKNNDSETLLRLLHPQYFYVTGDGMTLDRDAFLIEFQQKENWTICTEPDIYSIDTDGVVATVVTVVEGEFDLSGTTRSGTHRTYHTMIKPDGHWVFIAGHFS